MAEWHYGRGYQVSGPQASIHEFDEAARLLPLNHFTRNGGLDAVLVLHAVVPPREIERRLLASLATDPYSRDKLNILIFLAQQLGDAELAQRAANELARQTAGLHK